MSLISHLNEIDRSVLLFVNGPAGQSGGLDTLVVLIAGSPLAKGLPPILLFWGLWFQDGPDQRETRSRLTAVLFTAIAAIALGRALALLLPFRDRPIHTPGLGAHMPLHPEAADGLETWSSMPSDHAVLFFAFAVGLFLTNRTVGLLALAHATLVVALPRIYLGLHFPGDVLVGALTGVGLSLAMTPWLARVIDRGVFDRVAAYPQFLYPAMFMITFEIAELFDSVREGGEEVINLARGVLS